MTEEERRRLIEERRKREMTSDDFQRHIQATLQARAAGRPDPAPVTESGELIRPYADPRDEMIASSPALVRPVYSILDRMLRPGRAGMADRMNREYMEGLLQRDADQRRALAERQLIEAQGQKMQADAALAEVERKAAEGDPKSIDQLEKYSRAMYAGRRTGTPDYASQLIETFGGQDIRSQRGVAKPIGAEGATPSAAAPAATAPALTNISNMTRSEFNEYVPNRRFSLDNQMEAAQRIIDTEMIESLESFPGYGGSYSPPIKTQREATFGEIEAAKTRLKELQKEKQQLESTAELYSPTGSKP
jgi:hypothetical protein